MHGNLSDNGRLKDIRNVRNDHHVTENILRDPLIQFDAAFHVSKIRVTTSAIPSKSYPLRIRNRGSPGRLTPRETFETIPRESLMALSSGWSYSNSEDPRL